MPRSSPDVPVLTPKQAAFVAEYLVDLSATQAAIRAGYSARRADAIGYENLRKPVISAAIAEAQAARAQRTEVTADRILRELAVLGFSDVRNFLVDDTGRLTLRDGAPDEAWRAVSSVKHKIRTFTDDGGRTETNREIEFRLWDKNVALEKLAKHVRFYPPEKVELTGEDGGPVQVAGVALDELNDTQLAALAARLAGTKS
jgi:phage terminase small subunit